jgi:hypothetical protein
MFTSLHPGSSIKQPVTFFASVCLQSAVLAILCTIPASHISGPFLRHDAPRPDAFTPIYFHQEPIVPPSVPESTSAASRPAPAALVDAKPEVKTEVSSPAPVNSPSEAADSTPAKDEASSGNGDEQGIAPFPAWQGNSMAIGFGGMHHQVKPALPVFTPDPPILHGDAPEVARGKDVVLDIVINDQGVIAEVGVKQGVGGDVEKTIVETLKRWIFVPAKINGFAIASHQELRFHFPG